MYHYLLYMYDYFVCYIISMWQCIYLVSAQYNYINYLISSYWLICVHISLCINSPSVAAFVSHPIAAGLCSGGVWHCLRQMAWDDPYHHVVTLDSAWTCMITSPTFFCFPPDCFMYCLTIFSKCFSSFPSCANITNAMCQCWMSLKTARFKSW